MPVSPPRSPRPEVLAFLADIKEHPRDDGPRLIFADWLEETGDALDQLRAELIRSQIEFSRQPPSSPGWSEHGRRARALQRQHGDAWLGPLAAWVGGCWAHHRGLLAVRLTLAHLRSHALSALAGTEAWAWVDEMVITDAQDGDVARLGQGPLLSAIVSLGFQNNSLGPAGAQALAGLPLLRRLDKLDLSHNAIGDRGFRALLASPHLGPLRILELPGVGLRAEGATHLAQCEPMHRLERLNLRGNHLGSDGAAILAKSDRLPGLQHLDLHSNQIGNAGATAIAQASSMASLRELNLADNEIGPAGAHFLAFSPHLDRIASLILWGNPVGPDAVAALRQRFGSRVHVSGGPS